MRPWLAAAVCLAVIMMTKMAVAGTLPTSARALAAIERIRPSLEKQLADSGFQWGAPVFMRLFKDRKCLEVWLYGGRCFKLFRRFSICTYGWKGLGPKIQCGDGRAPEGFYYVSPRQLNPYSRFYLAFNLGYPNVYDRRHGRTGSALMVHGNCVSIGCFAMTDGQMEIIYALAHAALDKGQPFFRVHIFPFPMDAQTMTANCRTGDGRLMADRCRWIDFWANLKEGYDYFERYLMPPNVRVRNGRYAFEADECFSPKQ